MFLDRKRFEVKQARSTASGCRQIPRLLLAEELLRAIYCRGSLYSRI